MLLELASFPVRPPRVEGESLYGYVLRCYGSNGYVPPREVHRAINAVIKPKRTEGQEAALRLITHVLGKDRVVEQDLWLGSLYNSSIGQHDSFGWLRTEAKRVKLCPRCLSVHGFHWAAWQLPAANACLVHAEQLLEQCACGQALMWNRIGPGWTCQCGRVLTEAMSCAASAAQLELTRMVQRATGIPMPSFYRQVSKRDGPPVIQDLMTCYADLEFIHGLKTKIGRRQARFRKSFEQPKNSAVKLFVHWPQTLHRTLVRLIRFRCSDEPGHLVALCMRRDVEKLMTHLHGARQAGELSANLRSVAADLVAQLEAPIYSDSWVIFNPKYSADQRTQALDSLAAWWQEVATMIDPVASPERMPVKPTYKRRRVGGERWFDAPVTRFLDTLMGAALRGCAVHRFRRLALAWPPSMSVQAMDSLDLLTYLSYQLQSISRAHFQHLYELTCTAIAQCPSGDAL